MKSQSWIERSLWSALFLLLWLGSLGPAFGKPAESARATPVLGRYVLDKTPILYRTSNSGRTRPDVVEWFYLPNPPPPPGLFVPRISIDEIEDAEIVTRSSQRSPSLSGPNPTFLRVGPLGVDSRIRWGKRDIPYDEVKGGDAGLIIGGRGRDFASWRRDHESGQNHIDPKDLPTDWTSYLSVNTIFLSSDHAARVSDAAREAILRWVRLGNRLILVASDETGRGLGPWAAEWPWAGGRLRPDAWRAHLYEDAAGARGDLRPPPSERPKETRKDVRGRSHAWDPMPRIAETRPLPAAWRALGYGSVVGISVPLDRQPGLATVPHRDQPVLLWDLVPEPARVAAVHVWEATTPPSRLRPFPQAVGIAAGYVLVGLVLQRWLLRRRRQVVLMTVTPVLAATSLAFSYAPPAEVHREAETEGCYLANGDSRALVTSSFLCSGPLPLDVRWPRTGWLWADGYPPEFLITARQFEIRRAGMKVFQVTFPHDLPGTLRFDLRPGDQLAYDNRSGLSLRGCRLARHLNRLFGEETCYLSRAFDVPAGRGLIHLQQVTRDNAPDGYYPPGVTPCFLPERLRHSSGVTVSGWSERRIRPRQVKIDYAIPLEVKEMRASFVQVVLER